MIGADDDERRVALHHPPRGGEPVAREGVVGREIGELVPVVVDAVDHALVGARQRALELQIVGRVGEDQVDASLGELVHLLDAVADEDDVLGGGSDRGGASGRGGPSTQNLKLGGAAGRTGTRSTHQRSHELRFTLRCRWLCIAADALVYDGAR